VDTNKSYRIETIADLVAAAKDTENPELLIRDIGEWLRWHLALGPMKELVTMRDQEFIWHDDGRPDGHAYVDFGTPPDLDTPEEG